MKHIIVVATPDDAVIDGVDEQTLQDTVITVIEALFEQHYSAVYTQSTFNAKSAVIAVKKMYDVEE